MYLFQKTRINKLTYTPGINAAFHDSAASLIKDGELIAAAGIVII